MRVDWMTEEMLAIADDATNDGRSIRRATRQVHRKAVLRSKVRLETPQWLAARLDPQQWVIVSGSQRYASRHYAPRYARYYGPWIIGKPRPRSPDGAVASSGPHHIPRPGSSPSPVETEAGSAKPTRPEFESQAKALPGQGLSGPSVVRRPRRRHPW